MKWWKATLENIKVVTDNFWKRAKNSGAIMETKQSESHLIALTKWIESSWSAKKKASNMGINSRNTTIIKKERSICKSIAINQVLGSNALLSWLYRPLKQAPLLSELQ